MGVPGFFAWLLKNYNNKIIQKTKNTNTDILYLDSNCLFHPICFKTLDELAIKNPKILNNNDKLEEYMFENIIKYTEEIINYVKPTKYIFMAVDGVAPMSKLNQQRKRRYKSVYDSEIINNIKKKYNKPIYKWNNIVITPGTEFMEKLHNKLLDFVNDYNQKNKTKIIYSSYHTPGEGEHKILQHMKNNKILEPVIYGLDADLIFLAMASQIKNIYLLRESNELGNSTENKFLYVSIDITKKCYNEQINNIIEKKANNYNLEYVNNNYDYCPDFIFLCFLLGNDFLPHLPTLDIKKNGLNILLDKYAELVIKLDSFLYNIDTNTINDVFLLELIKNLANLEEYYYKNIYPKYIDKKEKKQCMETDDYKKEIWNLENMTKIDMEDNIKLGVGNKSEWKFRYYEYYFHSNNYQEELIKEVCNNYIEGLKWNLEYYFKKAKDYKWHYYYEHAPFLSDIYKHLLEVNINEIKFKENEPLKPYEQLLCVIPSSYSNILPLKLRKLMTDKDSPIIYMFPKKIKLDMLYKDMYYQCIPLLPNIDIQEIQKTINNLI
jgi:5'-3' exonuclease